VFVIARTCFISSILSFLIFTTQPLSLSNSNSLSIQTSMTQSFASCFRFHTLSGFKIQWDCSLSIKHGLCILHVRYVYWTCVKTSSSQFFSTLLMRSRFFIPCANSRALDSLILLNVPISVWFVSSCFCWVEEFASVVFWVTVWCCSFFRMRECLQAVERGRKRKIRL